VAWPAGQPRRYRPAQTAPILRPGSQHGRRRIRRDVQQPERRDRLRRRHRRAVRPRHRGADRHSAGEVEVRGADVAGMAVHIGARVAALAGPSEVLVSSTVRDIVTGSRHGSPTAVRAPSKVCRASGLEQPPIIPASASGEMLTSRLVGTRTHARPTTPAAVVSGTGSCLRRSWR
jgi:hypothetical protein